MNRIITIIALVSCALSAGADNLPLYLFILMFAVGSAGIITLAIAIFRNSQTDY
jgi:hypothetical protein